jgi:23S rRNA (guanine745-N1)-methyltransferase
LDTHFTPLCTVRDCRQPLILESRRLVCPKGHSFDIARSGYINLLQPQDRRSRRPGDSSEAVAARRRLHDLGISAPLLKAISDIISPSTHDTILDVGSGDGFYLGSLSRIHQPAGALGIDISIDAINAASRRYPGCEWIVANADRFVPCSDDSFSVVLSITGRMNPVEFRRVLRSDGRLLIALPAADDLIELRGIGRDRVARTIASFLPGFKLVDQRRATAATDLDASAIQDILLSIYRPVQFKPADAKPADAKKVTFSLDLLLFHPA